MKKTISIALFLRSFKRVFWDTLTSTARVNIEESSANYFWICTFLHLYLFIYIVCKSFRPYTIKMQIPTPVPVAAIFKTNTFRYMDKSTGDEDVWDVIFLSLVNMIFISRRIRTQKITYTSAKYQKKINRKTTKNTHK